MGHNAAIAVEVFTDDLNGSGQDDPYIDGRVTFVEEGLAFPGGYRLGAQAAKHTGKVVLFNTVKQGTTLQTLVEFLHNISFLLKIQHTSWL